MGCAPDTASTFTSVYVFIAAKSGFDLLKINVSIFVRFLLSHGKICLFFFYFSPPTRVSKIRRHSTDTRFVFISKPTGSPFAVFFFF